MLVTRSKKDCKSKNPLKHLEYYHGNI